MHYPPGFNALTCPVLNYIDDPLDDCPTEDEIASDWRKSLKRGDLVTFASGGRTETGEFVCLPHEHSPGEFEPDEPMVVLLVPVPTGNGVRLTHEWVAVEDCQIPGMEESREAMKRDLDRMCEP